MKDHAKTTSKAPDETHTTPSPEPASGETHSSASLASASLASASLDGERSADEDAEPPLAEARLRQQAIGQHLKSLFDEVINEPVPDEFLDILRRADSGGEAR